MYKTKFMQNHETCIMISENNGISVGAEGATCFAKLNLIIRNIAE